MANLWASCVGPAPEGETDPTPEQAADGFLSAYAQDYEAYRSRYEAALWRFDTQAPRADVASEAYRSHYDALSGYVYFLNDRKRLPQALELLKKADSLRPAQFKQLERVAWLAAEYPEYPDDIESPTVRRLLLESQIDLQWRSHRYSLGNTRYDRQTLLDAWAAAPTPKQKRNFWRAARSVSESVGEARLRELVELRNDCVRASGYPDYAAYCLQDYGMTRQEADELMRRTLQAVRPLYEQLHTFMRYELARQYGQEPPETLPEHWLSDLQGRAWGQALPDAYRESWQETLQALPPIWQAAQADTVFVRLGFASLPDFSSARAGWKPLPPEQNLCKWPLPAAYMVRRTDTGKQPAGAAICANLTPDYSGWEQACTSFAMAQAAAECVNRDTPLLLRKPPAPIFGQAIGELAAFKTWHDPARLALLRDTVDVPSLNERLLQEALQVMPSLVYSVVRYRFEQELYAGAYDPDVPLERYWQALKRDLQGVAARQDDAPLPLGALADPAFVKRPGYGFEEGWSTLLAFQLNAYLCGNLIGQEPYAPLFTVQDPRDLTLDSARQAQDALNARRIGAFFRSLLYSGRSEDWRALLSVRTKQPFGPERLAEYFRPLESYLRARNQGRVATLPPWFPQ